MAQRLTEASFVAERVDASSTISGDGQDADDDQPGLWDRIARSLSAMDELTTTLGSIAEEVEQVATLTTDAAGKIQQADARGRSLQGRLETFRELSISLDKPASRIQDDANRFTTELNDVDSGIQALVEMATEELAAASDKTALLAQLRTFRSQLDTLANSANQGLGSLDQMTQAIGPVENQSRNLRPVLRKIRRGLTVLTDGRDVINSWVLSIDDVLNEY